VSSTILGLDQRSSSFILESLNDLADSNSAYVKPRAKRKAFIDSSVHWLQSGISSGRDAELIRYRQSPRRQEFVHRIDRSDDANAALVEVLAALKLSSSCVT
jgi:hypothetical protein